MVWLIYGPYRLDVLPECASHYHHHNGDDIALDDRTYIVLDLRSFIWRVGESCTIVYSLLRSHSMYPKMCSIHIFVNP